MTEMTHEDQHAPVDVRVVGGVADRARAAEFGSWTGWKLLGTEPPFRVLPQDPKRKRAIIYVLPGFVNNNTTGAVFIGTLAQVSNGQGAVGCSGCMFEITSTQAVYIATDGSHSLTISTLDERFA